MNRMVTIRPSIRPLGQQAILLDWPIAPELGLIEEMYCLSHFLRQNLAGLLEVQICLQSLSLFFGEGGKMNLRIERVAELLDSYVNQTHAFVPEFTSHRIPVCYEGAYGKDMALVCDKLGLEREQVISLHLQTTYRVWMLGFMPGFPYLGGLPASLQLPRKTQPDKLMPKGSVAISESFCGIYPQDSPGGWWCIGRSPYTLFQSTDASPAPVLRLLDYVTFYRIDALSFEQWEKR